MKPFDLAARLQRIVAEECHCTASWEREDIAGMRGPRGPITRDELKAIRARTLQCIDAALEEALHGSFELRDV